MLKCYSSDISNPSFAIAFHPNKTDLLFFYEEEKTIKLLFKREKNISVNFTAYHCWTFQLSLLYLWARIIYWKSIIFKPQKIEIFKK